MAKVCDECGGKHFAKGKCRKHYKMPSQMRTNEKRSIVISGSIKLISDKQKAKLSEYRKARDKYFKLHPVCGFPGCESTEITLHHMKGRIGNFLTDKRYFKSLCLVHHRFVEENPTEAIKMGLSIKRLDK